MFDRPKKVDPFAKERALYHAMHKDDKKESAFDLVKTLLEERGILPVPPPEAGKDYFTEEEKVKFRDEIFSRIVVPEVKVDYEALHAYLVTRVVEEFSKVKVPEDGKPGKKGDKGEDGKDAVLDMKELVDKVVAQLPKPKKEKHLTLKEIKDYIDEIIKKIPPQPVRIGGSVASIRALTDVDISRMRVDVRGNYIFNEYNLFVGTVAPLSPQVNDLWVDTN